jgi:hypothetical protein
MNGLLDRLMSQLKDRGLSIGPGKQPGQLMLHGPEAERTPEILKALALFKPQLLEKFGARPPQTPEAKPEPAAEPGPEPEPVLCGVCNRDVSDPETRALMSDPLWCDRGGGKAYRDADGINHPEQKRCPHKK